MKNKNIHVLPTEKPSKLFIENDDTELCLFDTPMIAKYCTNQNIYITSDEEIKEGDWFINFDLLGRLDNIYDPIHKCLKVNNSTITSFEAQVEDEFTILKSFCKKIILTTDQKLIKDGVQAIDDEFLEWFVNNPSCERVEVEKDKFFESVNYHLYKIIILKEEPKQETDEEYFLGKMKEVLLFKNDAQAIRFMEKYFEAKLQQQQQMYSEEEVKKAFEDGENNVIIVDLVNLVKKKSLTQWFEQFKKKIRYEK